ncbi:MAG: S9 family peptidase, partial [Candidatus Marinimicrobia bacterium]|nr:S9 family peptidase [Candidatus Neomarinimicrobiota bacterium]
MNLIRYFLWVTVIGSFLLAQDGYKMPPKAIADLVDAPATPSVSISPDNKRILILGRASLPSIEELSQPELRLAGLRINPATNSRSRSSYYTGIVIQNIESRKQKRVKGFPNKSRISHVSWSPNGKKIAMAVTNGNSINIYVADVKTGRAKLLLKSPLNAIYGSPYYWLSDSKGLIAKT